MASDTPAPGTPAKKRSTSVKAPRTTSPRKAAPKRATTARSAAKSATTPQPTARAPRAGIDRVGELAERIALTGVGAALTARDNVLDLRASVTSRDELERQLRKARRDLERFERRGATARTRLERDVKKARRQVERELRQRRGHVGGAVETVQSAGASVVSKVSERVAAIA